LKAISVQFDKKPKTTKNEKKNPKTFIYSLSNTMSTIVSASPNQVIQDFKQHMEVLSQGIAQEPQGDQVTTTGEETEQEFVTVTRQKFRANIMIETAAFGDDDSSNKQRLSLLLDCLRGMAIPLQTPRVQYIRHPNQTDNAKPFFVFEVGTDAQLRATLQKGHANGKAVPFPFIHMNGDVHSAKVNRTMEIGSLHSSTTADDIQVALSQYGPVEHVALHRNKTGIQRAVITFDSADSVCTLVQSRITGLIIGSDTCLIRSLGDNILSFDKDLTLKLGNLPRGTTPVDLQRILAQHGQCYGLHVPFHPVSGVRRQEAFVYFANIGQQQAFRKKVFISGNRTMSWLNPDEKTCFGCGNPDHMLASCPFTKKRGVSTGDKGPFVQKQHGQQQSRQQAPKQVTPKVGTQQQPLDQHQPEQNNGKATPGKATAGKSGNIWVSDTLPHQRKATTSQKAAPSQAASSQAATPGNNGKAGTPPPQWKVANDKLAGEMDTIRNTLSNILKVLENLQSGVGRATQQSAVIKDATMAESQEMEEAADTPLIRNRVTTTHQQTPLVVHQSITPEKDREDSDQEDEDMEELYQLQDELGATTAELGDKTKELEAVRGQYAELQVMHETLNQRYQDMVNRLVNVEGQLSALQSQQRHMVAGTQPIPLSGTSTGAFSGGTQQQGDPFVYVQDSQNPLATNQSQAGGAQPEGTMTMSPLGTFNSSALDSMAASRTMTMSPLGTFNSSALDSMAASRTMTMSPLGTFNSSALDSTAASSILSIPSNLTFSPTPPNV
jgi:RNA recognition motif-containing protein